MFAQAFDDVRRGFGGELLVGEAGFVGGDLFFELGEVFGEALAFGGDVDMLFVEHGHVKVRGRAGVVAGDGGFGDLDAADTGQASKDFLAPFEAEEEAGGRVQTDGGGFLLRHAQLLTECTDGDDEFLQKLHLADGCGVRREVRGLRIAGERDGPQCPAGCLA